MTYIRQVCERDNLRLAYQRVVEKKAAAGVDGIIIAECKDHLAQHSPPIKAKMLTGRTSPSRYAGWTCLGGKIALTAKVGD